jgi:hypothetical protein
MVVLATIASVVVCDWIAVWPQSDDGAAWIGAVAALPAAMPPAGIGTVMLRRHRRRAPQATAPRTSSRFGTAAKKPTDPMPLRVSGRAEITALSPLVSDSRLPDTHK